ncbi:MAG: UvrD-helicase domain-containing protein [Bacteroidetes bacterium]|nr:UvrD-helicase domain-containing protein [Bacteroidota bacterium]
MNFTVYKASAGAGKTYTLVKEFLKLSLADRKPEAYRGILAITFTNKAAAEMKERVLIALKAIAADEEPTGTPAFLQQDLMNELQIEASEIKERSRKVIEHMLHNYSDLSISTIDKFTHKIIRTFAYDLRLPINFEIEMDERNLVSKAVDILISKVGLDDELTQVLIDFTESKLSEEKDWHIERDLKAFAQGMFSDEATEYLERLRKISLPEFIIIKDKIQDFVKAYENTLEKIGNEALGLITENGIGHAAFAGGANGLPKFFFYLSEKRSDKYLASDTVQKNMLEEKWYSAKATAAEKAAIDGISSKLFELFHSACNQVLGQQSDYIVMKLIYRYIHSLMVLKEIDLIVNEIKKENNILQISDFNKIISAIVSNEPAPFIYERIGEKYKHYLIDEFQDTSILQWQNLLPLLDNSLGNGNFNMIVGDGKQSIYRWRGGDVEQFALLPKLYKNEASPIVAEREASLGRNYLEKPLKNNFRSKMEIVDFNNRFFANSASTLPDDFREIYKNNAQEFNPENTGGYVQLEFCNEKKLEDFTLEEINCGRILEIITENLSEGFQLKDMAILFRRNREASVVANFLMENGINVISSESLLLCNAPQVKFIIDFLSYLSAPENETAKAAILRHLYFNVLAEPEGFPEALKAVKAANYKFEHLLSSKGYVFSSSALLNLSIYESCEEILRIFSLEPQMNGYIRFFMEHVHNFSCRNTSGIYGFLDWWEEKKNNLSVVVPKGMDAVSIMTIHKSKGLEFPLVIFPFANWKVNNAKDNFWIKLEENNKISLDTAVIPVTKQLEETIYKEMYTEEVSKSQLDHLNLLYVAMTRPEERMYILTSVSPYKNLSKNFIEYLKAAGEWEDEDKIYGFGAKMNKEFKAAAILSNTYQPERSISENWKKKIQISRLAPDRWQSEEPENQRNYGNLLHQALSKITNEASVDATLKNMGFEGLISAEEQKELKLKIMEVLTHPVAGQWFKEKTVINEREILKPDGSIYRPDKVIIKEKETIIIDFKTGKKQEEKHKQQLEDYAQALKEMDYLNIKRYLFYTDGLEVLDI